MFSKIKSIIKKKYNDKKNIQLIKNSNLFSKKYYMIENPDIKMDPAKHYYYYGYKEGKSPSYYFSNDSYLKLYKDVEKNGMNPLIHYLKYGNKEKRRILKDNGCSISEIYYKLCGYYYNYNLFICDSKIKRINLFIEDVLCVSENFIKNVVNYCIANELVLRFIYRKFDISELKDILNDFKADIEYTYLNNNDYIFVSDEDIYICTGLKTAFALINSIINDKKIFLYLDKYNDCVENNWLITELCNYEKLIFISCNERLQDKIDTYKIVFNVERKFNSKKIYYYSNQFTIPGFLLLNKLFLDGIYDSKYYSVHAVNNKIKYHFDTDVITYNFHSDCVEKEDCLFYLTDEEKGKPVIVAKMEKSGKKIPVVMLKTDDMKEISLDSKEISDKNRFYEDFKLKMIEARKEE